MRTLITRFDIGRKVNELSKEIGQDYNPQAAKEELVLVGVMKGAFRFLSDLSRNLSVHAHLDSSPDILIDFISVSSYVGTQSSGEVRLEYDTEMSMEDRHVILVEDIIDTGRTMKFLLDNFSNREPESLSVCTLLSKPSRREVEVPIDYCGFEIPNEFVVGYGLDFNEKYRGLPYIGVLEEKE